MKKDDLKEYKDKRDFDKTGEPDSSNSNSDKIFVIQKHDASNLHYDFRFSYNGVLKSWAVPKGVPKKGGVKHLAIRTEDHPLDYADFEGEIPEDQYGGGTVEIYDRGTYENIRSKSLRDSFYDGKIGLQLNGDEIEGKYYLIHTDDENWLILKKKKE